MNFWGYFMWAAYLILCALVLSSFSCSKSDRPPPTVQGNIQKITADGMYMVGNLGPVKAKKGEFIFIPNGLALKKVEKKK